MISVLIFLAGAALLVVSAEKLIAHLVGAGSGLRVPLFLLAIIFTGIEFDDITLGVALNLEDLSGVALGIVFGTAMTFSGVVLALAAMLKPSKVDVPRDYVVLFAGAPLVMVVFTLTAHSPSPTGCSSSACSACSSATSPSGRSAGAFRSSVTSRCSRLPPSAGRERAWRPGVRRRRMKPTAGGGGRGAVWGSRSSTTCRSPRRPRRPAGPPSGWR